MSREKVDISVDANVASAIAAMMELVKTQGKLGEGAEEVGRRGASASKSFAAELDHVAGKWFSIGKAIDLARGALKQYFEEGKRLREEQVNATKTIDAGLTTYRVHQGNLSHAAGLEAAQNISTIAQQNRASNESGFATASLLAQYHVGRSEAEGPALAELLQLQDLAQAQGKIDPGALSKAVLDALQRSRQPINGQSIRRVGSAAFSLSQKLKGFDAGEIGISANVATLGRNAGMSFEETMAVVGALSEDYGEASAGRQFRKLFKDNKFTSAERGQISGLQGRARGLLSGAPADYAGAVAIAGGSMADEEARAQAGYEASGFRPGAMDSESVRKRLMTAMRQEGVGGPWNERIVGWEFGILDWINGPEFAVNTITGAPMPGDRQSVRRIRERALGREEMTVRLLAPDGRDVPIQVEAEALNQDFSNDATQSGNFRPN